GLGVSANSFESHLEWLQSECQIVDLEKLLSTAPEHLPPRAVALTFDDGYEDNLRLAAPLLQPYGAPSPFLLTTRWLDGYGEYWWDTLERVLLSETPIPESLDVSRAGLPGSLSTRTAEDRRAAHRHLHDVLVHAFLAQEGRVAQAAGFAPWWPMRSGSSRPFPV